MVTDEQIRITVLIAPSLTLSSPCGHSTAPTRRRMYVENSAPKSMTSDARNNQIPSLPLARPVSGRGSTVYGISMLRTLRFELRREVFGGARHAVLVCAAIDDGLGHEIAVARRRRRRPLERRRFPRIPIDERAPLDAREEVDDEGNLEQAQPPRREADYDVPVQQPGVVRVLH